MPMDMIERAARAKDTMPAWEVTIYGRVGWFDWVKSTGHPVQTFRSLKAAEKHIAHRQSMSKFSLIPVWYKGEIREVTRPRDWRDKLKAMIDQALKG